jgi:hypothetical protein
MLLCSVLARLNATRACEPVRLQAHYYVTTLAPRGARLRNHMIEERLFYCVVTIETPEPEVIFVVTQALLSHRGYSAELNTTNNASSQAGIDACVLLVFGYLKRNAERCKCLPEK